MIKFFKHIRQRLLTENKFSKYLLYAIGEIVLVMIGILLALQVNNWNEANKGKKAEQVVLKNLAHEFKSNHKDLISLKTTITNCYEANKTIMSFFNKERRIIEKKNTDSLIFYSLEFDRFSPSENVLQDLLQSGRLDLISKDSLRNALFDWTRTLKLAEERYDDCFLKLIHDLIPYLTQNFVFKDLDQYSNQKWENPSEFKVDKLALFNDRVYENLVDDFIYRINRYLLELGKLESIIENIQNQIDD
ncbi:MAG: hypothetical protein KJN85_09050 [Maribacter sp.]|nr:hypothetical protein [Maribacter sp.]MBT8315875.1 hypothetical protein [Maribacter sp.]